MIEYRLHTCWLTYIKWNAISIKRPCLDWILPSKGMHLTWFIINMSTYIRTSCLYMVRNNCFKLSSAHGRILTIYMNICIYMYVYAIFIGLFKSPSFMPYSILLKDLAISTQENMHGDLEIPRLLLTVIRDWWWVILSKMAWRMV